MVKVSLWTTLLGFISMLTVYSITFSQTKDCNDLDGDYVCIESRFVPQKINWCQCGYAFYAYVYYFSPRLAYFNYHIGFLLDTAVGFHSVCRTIPPKDEFPVWIGEVN
jgi:hypothetical protein